MCECGCDQTLCMAHRRLQAHGQAHLGIARVILNHITKTGREDTWSPAYNICVHRRTYSVQCSDKIPFLQLRHSQVLPGYPHSSAGIYGMTLLLFQIFNYTQVLLHTLSSTSRYKTQSLCHTDTSGLIPDGKSSVLLMIVVGMLCFS